MAKKKRLKQVTNEKVEVKNEVKPEQGQAEVPPQPPVTPPIEKRSYRYETIAEELNKFRVALDNSLTDASLQGPMAAYGYTIDRIQENRTLLTTIKSLSEAQLRGYGLQYEATIFVNRLRERANQEYVRLLKIARVAFKNTPGVSVQLILSRRRAKSLGDWIQQANLFFDNSLGNPEILAGFSTFNITADVLQAAKVMVEEVKTAETRQEDLKGESQRATDLRDKTFEELKVWMSGYVQIARIAFSNDRQQLEKLGVVAR
jgi:hypothetical protein